MGGSISKVAEIATGGLIKSDDTKAKEAAAAEAVKEQEKLVREEADRVAQEEEDRKNAMLKKRQGRRSLMYQEGDETGVTTSATMGG